MRGFHYPTSFTEKFCNGVASLVSLICFEIIQLWILFMLTGSYNELNPLMYHSREYSNIISSIWSLSDPQSWISLILGARKVYCALTVTTCAVIFLILPPVFPPDQGCRPPYAEILPKYRRRALRRVFSMVLVSILRQICPPNCYYISCVTICLAASYLKIAFAREEYQPLLWLLSLNTHYLTCHLLFLFFFIGKNNFYVAVTTTTNDIQTWVEQAHSMWS